MSICKIFQDSQDTARSKHSDRTEDVVKKKKKKSIFYHKEVQRLHEYGSRDFNFLEQSTENVKLRNEYPMPTGYKFSKFPILLTIAFYIFQFEWKFGFIYIYCIQNKLCRSRISPLSLCKTHGYTTSNRDSTPFGTRHAEFQALHSQRISRL